MTAFLHIGRVYVKKAQKIDDLLHIEPVYVKEARKKEDLP